MFCTQRAELINNCLVVCIGIAKYEEYTKIPSIADISDDMKSYTNTFQQIPNYTVITNDIDKMYTKASLLEYLSDIFHEHLYDASTNSIKHNGLIITISAHCTESSVICSDGDKLALPQILGIFTGNWKIKELIANLPKFMIVDGCRGYDYNKLMTPSSDSDCDEKKQNAADYDLAAILMKEKIMETYSSIMCSVSAVLDSKAYSGQLSWNLSQAMKEQIVKQQDIVFQDLVHKTRQRINHASHFSDYQFSIDFIEHDMDIDAAVFSMKLLKKTQQNGYDEMQLKQLVKRREKEQKKLKKEAKASSIRFKRSQSVGMLGRHKAGKKEKEKSKEKEKKKEKQEQRSKSPLSPRNLFKNRTQSVRGAKSADSKLPKSFFSAVSPSLDSKGSDSASDAYQQTVDDVQHDPLFRDAMDWQKSVEVVSRSKEKTRVKVTWSFVVNKKTHCVVFAHSQKSNPYAKSKRVLTIDGKQRWTQKSTATQFTEMHENNVLTVSIGYNEKEKRFEYELKINNKAHSALFQEWQATNMYVE